MCAITTVNPRLEALTRAGTSVWLDQIRRGLIETGELQRLVDEDCLRGVTANPAIFEKAILGSSDYDDDLAELAREGLEPEQIYERLAIRDVQLAADALHPVWEATGTRDGFVSLEVSPKLANDTDRTLAEVRSFWQRLDRPNVLIKIPATAAGVPAIEQALYEGINVNITLLFSVARYSEVVEAYLRALERRRAEGKSLAVHSVASFFVSRVDTKADKQLGALGRSDLLGTAAIANARSAYQLFVREFATDRFASLAGAGAFVQRPLWASTGTKNPHYSETKYVDELIGSETVNTMPLATLLAFAERGSVVADTADQDPKPQLDALAEAGVDLDEITTQLLKEGIEAFDASFEKLLAGVRDRRDAVITGRPQTIAASVPEGLQPPIAQRVQQAAAANLVQRIWRKDPTLWGPAGTGEIADRLGWLTISEPMLEDAPHLREFAQQCRDDGLVDAVLLGMGGSSLGPEVIRRSFAQPVDGLRLHVLDSTDPNAIASLERSIDLERTLFVVSSKSGTTLETLSHFRYFHARVAERIQDDPGRRFVAVTDPGSPLTQLAREHGFRRVFENDPDIGGRYSVMSYFGLVPAALMGVSVDALLHRCQVAEQNCASYDQSAENSGLWLGLAAGELALRGRDKLTFVVSDPISSFGLWVEQLIAESTGKQGRGILPVAGEPIGDPDVYGDDRVFCYLRNGEAPDPALDAKLSALAEAGQPTLTLSVHGPSDLGRIFFFAEFATAVAGWVLEINAFNQPNVQEAKDHTNQVLDQYRREGKLPEIADADDRALRELILGAGTGEYVAIMAYAEPSPQLDEAISELRIAIRERTGCATTFGYGPRYLHSTGQMHKGGPPTGRFLQLVHDGGADIEIPQAGYSFATLKHAQAVGDLETLRRHGRPAERMQLSGDPVSAVQGLTNRIRGLD